MKTLKIIFLMFLLPAIGWGASIKGTWVLDHSLIEYTVTHPLHHVYGKSTEARGKGICTSSECDFIVGVPVKSFNSGDSDRDLHMLQITQGAKYPLIVAHVTFPTPVGPSLPKEVLANLEIQFAGQNVKYSNVKVGLIPLNDSQVRVISAITLNLKAFKIPAPSLLGIPIHNLVPVTFDMIWKKINASDSK